MALLSTPPHKFVRQPRQYYQLQEIRKYEFRVDPSGITSISNFIQVRQAVLEFNLADRPLYCVNFVHILQRMHCKQSWGANKGNKGWSFSLRVRLWANSPLPRNYSSMFWYVAQGLGLGPIYLPEQREMAILVWFKIWPSVASSCGHNMNVPGPLRTKDFSMSDYQLIIKTPI
jgi:hypothetical protein